MGRYLFLDKVIYVKLPCRNFSICYKWNRKARQKVLLIRWSYQDFILSFQLACLLLYLALLVTRICTAQVPFQLSLLCHTRCFQNADYFLCVWKGTGRLFWLYTDFCLLNTLMFVYLLNLRCFICDSSLGWVVPQLLRKEISLLRHVPLNPRRWAVSSQGSMSNLQGLASIIKGRSGDWQYINSSFKPIRHGCTQLITPFVFCFVEYCNVESYVRKWG